MGAVKYMNNKEAVWKLLALLKGYEKSLLIIMGGLFVSSGLNLCIPLLSRQIMDVGFMGGNYGLLVKLVLLTSAIYIVDSIINVMKEKKRVDISTQIQYFLSKQSFKHLMKLKVSYFNNRNYAEIMNNVNVDVNKMATIADSSVFFVVTQAFSMIGGIIGLFIIDYRMTLLVLVFIPIKYIVMKYFAKKQKSIVDDFIVDKKNNEFEINQKNILDKQKEMNMLSQWNGTVDSIMLQLLSTILYIVGANLVFDFQLSVGSVFAFITYSSYVTGPISAILNIGYLLSGIIPSTKRYYEFMDLQEESDVQKIKEIDFGDLELRNVCFEYKIDNPVLKDIVEGNRYCGYIIAGV